MAIVRCEDCGRPIGRTRRYICSVEPLNFPDSAVICGKKDCENTGLVWLEAQERRDYQEGKRIFHLNTRTTKVRVKD